MDPSGASRRVLGECRTPVTSSDLKRLLNEADHEKLSRTLHLTRDEMQALLDGTATMDAGQLVVLAHYAEVPASALINLALR